MPHDFQLWCEDCQKGYEGECEEHGPLTHVNDTEIGTRARRSLPKILKLKEEENKTGVFSEETLANRLRFGPLQGIIEKDSSKYIKVEEEIRKGYGIVYKLIQENDDVLLIDTRFEDLSNWMIFVKPAVKKSEQNLVAFQYKGKIYFATIKEIPPQSELKIWYSKDYAEKMKAKLLPDDSASWQLRARPKYSCLSCEAVFSSSSSLHHHRCPKRKLSVEGFPSRKRIRKRSYRVGPLITKVSPSLVESLEVASTSQEEIKLKPVITASPLTKALSLKEQSSLKVTTVIPTDSSDSDSQQEVTSETKETLKGVYDCTVCKKSFNSPGKLKQHSYSHTGERPFSCPHCQKAFSSRFKLGRHQLIHTGIRQHQCPLCSRSFHRKDHLKNHIQIHDPNKQFKCERPDCGKEYNSYMSYRKHCAVHAAEEGDLECKICYETFENKTDLIYHLKVHVGTRTVKSPSEKKFQCDFCERRFFTRKDVKRHLVVHTGKRDFICNLCPQKFGRKDHLVRHIKKSHGEPTRLEITDPLSLPGPSSAQQAPSPEAALMSSTSASSGEQPFSSVLIREALEPTLLPSKMLTESISSHQEAYEIGRDFPTDIRFFEAIKEEALFGEEIKEEPELTASITDPGGDDISKILGIYLPGTINLPVPSLLETSEATPMPSEDIRPLQISAGEPETLSRMLIVSASDEGNLTPTQLLPVSASEELSQVYTESLLEPPQGIGPTPPLTTCVEEEVLSQPISLTTQQPSISTTTTTTTTVASSVVTTLPGFHQAFP